MFTRADMISREACNISEVFFCVREASLVCKRDGRAGCVHERQRMMQTWMFNEPASRDMKTRELYSLQRKHPRPKRLSDPFHDNTPESLRELLSKSDTDMGWGDF